MIKAVGLIFMVAASGLMGMMKSVELKERIELLEDYLKMVLEVKGHINYFREPLMVIFDCEGKNQLSKAFEFLDRLRHDLAEKNAEIDQIWAQNVDLIYERCPLLPEDMDLLKYPGTFIGQTDYENQLAHFDYLEKRLDEQIASSRDVFRIKGPLYRKIGFFVGGLAAIMVI